MLGAKMLDEIEDQSVGTLFPLVLGHLNLSNSLMPCISTFLPKPYTCIHYSFPHMLPLLIIHHLSFTTYHLSYHSPLIIHQTHAFTCFHNLPSFQPKPCTCYHHAFTCTCSSIIPSFKTLHMHFNHSTHALPFFNPCSHTFTHMHFHPHAIPFQIAFHSFHMHSIL